jgi:hypothetical protein
MTPEQKLRGVRLAVVILTFSWLMHAILVHWILYNHALQAEAFRARLEKLEAKVGASSTK